MTGSATDVFTTLPLADAERLDQVCDAFEAAWRDEQSEPPRLDDFLTPLAAEMQSAALLELLPIELAYLKQRGSPISASDYRRRYPTAAPYLDQWLADRPQQAARQLAAGERFGKYTITAFVDAGGMGELYRATDQKLGREVAIKVLLHRYRWSREALARISTEAQALAALNHPHIVTVHELAEHDGIAYIAMEFLVGQTLADRLQKAELPAEEALQIASALAEALAAAHRKNIIHRDLKPQNIYLTACGPKVLDFGLARLAELQVEPAGLEEAPRATNGNGTATGSRVGTTGYMSPEQIRGQGVDARTDIFSFGCVLYEMLFGSAAFKRGSREETDEATLHAPLPRPDSAAGGLAESLYGVCERCLQKAPAERYASALQLSQQLTEIETNHVQRPQRARQNFQQNLLAAASLLLVGLSIWSAELTRQAELNRQVTELVAELAHAANQRIDYRAIVRELIRLGEKLDEPEKIDRLIRNVIHSEPDYLCVMGYVSLERGRKKDILKAIERFEICRSNYPGHAPASVGLGQCHYALSNAYATPLAEMQEVKKFAEEARRFGDTSGAALVLMGIFEHRFNWAWQPAEDSFQNALRENSKSATALHMYGNALVLQRQFPEGIKKLKDAKELDPKSLQIRTDLGLAHMYSDNRKEAQAEIQNVLDEEPDFFPARWALGETYLWEGIRDKQKAAFAAAIRELERACELEDSSVEAEAELAFCYGRSGSTQRAQEIIDKLQRLKAAGGEDHVPPTALAVAQLGVGDLPSALSNLEEGSRQHDEWLVWLAVDPVFEDLRKVMDPRFKAIWEEEIKLWPAPGVSP